MKRAFITGVGGQDGYYLSELLLEKGYEVVACGRPWSLAGERGDGLRAMGVKIVDVDLIDREMTRRAVAELRPDEIYNMAGHSFVPQSWDDPATAIRITSWPVIHLMDAMRAEGAQTRFYQSTTSEIFGRTRVCPQTESTPVEPTSPYAAAKVFAHELVALYRNHYGLYACSGILYNHESPRRPPQFVSAKIAHAAKRIQAGKDKELKLGDLDVMRDWGYARDYVEAMWLMLQQPEPDDFIIGTGVPHKVRDLCRIAFECVGLDYREHVRVDQALERPWQPTQLLANPEKARRKLGWAARTSFEELIRLMVEAAPG